MAILAGGSYSSLGRRYRGLKTDDGHFFCEHGLWSWLVVSEENSDLVCCSPNHEFEDLVLICLSERVRELWYHGYDHYMKHGEFSHLNYESKQ